MSTNNGKPAFDKARHVCPECGSLRVLTAAGAYLCPNAHGRVIANCKPGEAHRAARDWRRIQWLGTFPEAVKQKRGWLISGANLKRSLVLKAGQEPLNGETAARVENRVYLFVPLKQKAKRGGHPRKQKRRKRRATSRVKSKTPAR